MAKIFSKVAAFISLTLCATTFLVAEDQTAQKTNSSTSMAAPSTQPSTLSASDQYKQIVDRAEFFYDKAFAHLLQYIITIVTVAGIVIGIVIPVFNNILQLRALKHSEESLKKTQSDLITEAENRIRKEISGIVEKIFEEKLSAHQKKLAEMEAKFREEIAIQKGNVHHVAGKGWSNEKKYGNAAVSYADAACAFLEGDHEVMVKRALVLLSKFTLKHCGPEEMKFAGQELKKLSENLSNWTRRDRNQDEVDAFESAYEEAKQRKETPKNVAAD